MFPRHPEPLRNFDYLGAHRYFLTWCCFERQPLFQDSAVADRAMSQIMRACDPCGIAIVAYCFMPDHLHMLVEGMRLDADGRRFFKLAKQYAGYAHSQATGSRLWQRYGYEHVVRSDQTSRAGYPDTSWKTQSVQVWQNRWGIGPQAVRRRPTSRR